MNALMPLARVLRPERDGERLPLVFDAELEGPSNARLTACLASEARAGSSRRWSARPASTPRATLPADDACDEPGRLRLARREEPPGEDHVHRHCLADARASRCVPPAPGISAEIDLRLAELRGLGRDDQVAEHRELAAAAEAEPDTAATIGLPISRIESQRASRFVVVGSSASAARRPMSAPAANARSDAAEHDAANPVVLVELPQGIHDLAHQLVRERVQLLRAVDQHDPDRPSSRSTRTSSSLIRHTPSKVPGTLEGVMEG